MKDVTAVTIRGRGKTKCALGQSSARSGLLASGAGRRGDVRLKDDGYESLQAEVLAANTPISERPTLHLVWARSRDARITQYQLHGKRRTHRSSGL